jgi:hypothetical protein
VNKVHNGLPGAASIIDTLVEAASADMSWKPLQPIKTTSRKTGVKFTKP